MRQVIRKKIHAEFKYRETEFANDGCIFSGGQSRVVFAPSPGADHFPGTEDQGSCFRVTYAHNHGWKTLGVVFSIANVHDNLL